MGERACPLLYLWYNEAEEVKVLERTVSPKLKADEVAVEVLLRPKTLQEFIGQERVKENIKILLEAAQGRGEAVEHVLFCGPPGLGKTTLANIIAHEMGVKITVTSGPAVERVRDFAAIVSRLGERHILFIDEAHRLPRPVEEMLYPAMEDRCLDIIMGKGLKAHTLRLRLKPFTVIGATTRMALMTSPLRARFGVIYRLGFYSISAMEQIVRRSAKILGVEIEEGGCQEIARRGRGTPRVANRLLRRVRDYAQVRADGVITAEVARQALELLEVDSLGLDEVDRKIIETIIHKFNGGPVGVDTIAASISEEADTIMDVYEPYLLQLGFIDRTPRGRVGTKLAYEHLGLPYEEGQPTLF